MAKKTITIDSVTLGLSPLGYFTPVSRTGNPLPYYSGGLGFDPDMPISDSATRMSGYIRPTAMAKFSGSTITDTPLWLVTNPKDTNCYCYGSTGKVYSISSALSVSALNAGVALTAALGNGGEYYDNYIYLTKNTDVCRYGPLNGSPAFVENYWTATLAKTSLTNTTYPSINGVLMPNHVMHRHTNNKVYICDVTSGNKGVLHAISTTKTTVEGDTDNGSGYNVLDFGYGYYPTTSETYGTDLAVALIEGTSTAIKQKPACLTFWDTTSSSFSKLIQVEFPDPLITALRNVNGVLYVWSGNANGGYRVSKFAGGYSFEEIYYSDQGYPPLQGAVDGELNRVIWGTPITYPSAAGCVMAYGSRSEQVGGGVHNILKTTAGSSAMTTAVKYVQTTANNIRQPIVGWVDASSQGIDKSTTTYGTSTFRSEVFRIGKPFTFVNARILLAQPVAANHAGTVKIYIDNESSNTTLATINNTTYPNGEINIKIQNQPVLGKQNFFIELQTTGTALMTFALPIEIEIFTNQD